MSYLVLLLVLLIFLEHLGFDQFVDELLHGVERGEEALRRHDDADVALRRRFLAIFIRLKRHEIEADHTAREMDLPDAVCEDFFLVCHCVAFLFVLICVYE